MSRFSDQLFTDLMNEHGPALAALDRPHAPARRAARRSVRLAGSAAGVAVAVTARFAVWGGGSPAYAITENTNGRITLAINRPSGIDGANTELTAKGLNVVVVPVRAGCVELRTLSAVVTTGGSGRVTSAVGVDGRLTVDVKGIPDGETAVVGASTSTDAALGEVRVPMTLGGDEGRTGYEDDEPC